MRTLEQLGTNFLRQRVWLCNICGRTMPRTEDNLRDILNRIPTLKPCVCGANEWQATVKEPTE